MSPREKELLGVLAEKMPARFRLFDDEDFGAVFHDCVLHLSYDNPQLWIMTTLESLDIAAIWKEEGRTWQESILNAIVHKLTEMPECDRGK